jgi:hypothetical protein
VIRIHTRAENTVSTVSRVGDNHHDLGSIQSPAARVRAPLRQQPTTRNHDRRRC